MSLDIIIPAYNAKDTLLNTLSSILIQKGLEKEDYQVTIVNDYSDYSYSSFINYFTPYMNIKEIHTNKNVGPGEARNLGLKSSNQEYIIFIDSDDSFYGINSIKSLLNEIKKDNYDLVISSFICESNKHQEIKKNDLTWLHGKIYRRSFLQKHDIHFNNTKANEDNGFNQLVLLMNPKIKYLSTITYIYKENPSSITRKNNRLYQITGLEGLIYNINWASEEGLKRNCDKNKVILLAMKTLISMYYYYLELNNKYDVSPIIKWSKTILNLYNRYPELALSEDEINIHLNIKKQKYIQNNIPLNKILSFQEFIQKVEKVQ